MKHDELQAILKQAFSVKLLTSPHASLILSFLDDQFKQSGRATIPHHELTDALDAGLQALRQHDARRYPGSAPHYLSQWCDDQHRFLRKYYAVGSDDPVYELTSESERALGWVEDLRKASFVGTESRFLHILALLQDIAVHGSTDVTLRLKQLHAQQADLQAQIDRLSRRGEVERYSDTQLKERFGQVSEAARRLLADFREVEENFRDIARTVQEQQFQAGTSKGDILRYVLDTDAALKTSDQGRSFYSFWQFLLSPSKQDELRELLDTVFAIPEFMHGESEHQQNVRHLKRHLLEAGSQIVASNRRLMQQLRKILDETHAAEAQRVRDLIAEIYQATMQVASDFPEDETFLELEGTPAIDMPAERQLWEPASMPRFGDERPQAGEANLAEAHLQTLYNQLYVDEQLLRRHIDTLLEQHPTVTLSDVVAAYPIERGLTEVITYLSIAAKEGQHRIDNDVQDTIPLGQYVEGRDITLPRITFARS
jgi:hypothetical protein